MSATSFKTLVTGTSRGIGLETVKQLLRDPKRMVYATARNPSHASELIQLQSQFRERLFIEKLDVTSEESIKNLVDKLKHVKFDLLVNNAGIIEKNDPITSTTKESLLKAFETNALAPLFVSQHFYNQNLLNKGALIVNISSILGSIDFVNEEIVKFNYSSSYLISKAALNMISKIQSVALKDVHTISVHPGWLKTDLGGEGAPLDVGVGVSGIVKVIDTFKPEQNGAFLQFDGERLNW